jgi:magnesium transporter
MKTVAEPDDKLALQRYSEGTTEASGYELESVERDVVEALAEGDLARAKGLIGPLHYADLADLLEHLAADDRRALVEIIRDDLDPDMLSELDESIRDDVIEQLGVAEVAAAVAELDTDDAVDFIEELDEEEQRQLLAAMPESDRALIEQALAYPEDSAGRLMQREIVRIPTFWDVGQTLDYLRQHADRDQEVLPEVFYVIFVVDPHHRPVGQVSLSRLLRTRRAAKIAEIMETDMKVIAATTDQEEVAFLFRQRDLVSAPVVDEAGRLVGAITVDDVVDVIHEENEEDLMHMGGVSEDDFYSAAVDTAKSRFRWLFVNLCTAFVAASVIGMFEATIEKIVALAVLMPIVASMGGNAGTQALTVAVRALAMKELGATNAMRVIGKEVVVGGFNGLLFAAIAGLVSWLWFGDPEIALIIGAAMITNLVVAGFAGSTIPILLEKLGVDPAIASSVFLTTMTDVIGFLAFLGLATLFLL